LYFVFAIYLFGENGRRYTGISFSSLLAVPNVTTPMANSPTSLAYPLCGSIARGL